MAVPDPKMILLIVVPPAPLNEADEFRSRDVKQLYSAFLPSGDDDSIEQVFTIDSVIWSRREYLVHCLLDIESIHGPERVGAPSLDKR